VGTVGIPRALLYYHYIPVWRAFFGALDIEVIVSPPTTGQTVTRGAERVVSETCLPVKVYCGHVLSLLGRVDCVLVPSVDRLRPGTRNCPKLIGLPDLIASAIPEAPLLSVDVHGEGDWPSLSRLALLLAKYWIVNPLSLRRAIGQARAAAEAVHTASSLEGTGGLTIAIVGHPYNLYDDYVTHRLIDRLRALGVHIVTPEAVSLKERWACVRELAEVPYWSYEDEYVGAGGCLLGRTGPQRTSLERGGTSPRRGVDGLLSVSAFGCAPDSVMSSVLAQAARRADVPYMALVLDEHSGQAGLITRLEAFVDMLVRRKERR
jgi:predicted nucleotide-binding protein (sugar kinase/HSP70/actin superfamily)